MRFRARPSSGGEHGGEVEPARPPRASFVYTGAEIVDARIVQGKAPASRRTSVARSRPTSPVARALEALLVVGWNCVPLWGVKHWGWSAFAVLALYWMESLVVGSFHLARLRLIQAHRAAGPWPGAEPLGDDVGFFARTYGTFCLVHGILLFAFFWLGPGGPPDVPWVEVAWAVLALFGSHGAAFLFDFWLPGRHRTAEAEAQAFQPFARLIVAHLTLIFGGISVIRSGDGTPAVVWMIILKTAVELLAILLRTKRVHP